MLTVNQDDEMLSCSPIDIPERQLLMGKTDQWEIFKEFHCKVWFGKSKQLNSHGVPIKNYKVMHSFKETDEDTIEHSNVYYYDDQTISSGPQCGPWQYKRSLSKEEKVVRHPLWSHTRLLYFPDGSGCLFNNSPVFNDQVITCNKIILMHPFDSKLRQSVLFKYVNYELENIKHHQESSKGFHSDFWKDENASLESDMSNSKWSLESSQTLDINLNLTKTVFDDPKLLESLSDKYLKCSISPSTVITCPYMWNEEQPLQISVLWKLATTCIKMVMNFDSDRQFTDVTFKRFTKCN